MPEVTFNGVNAISYPYSTSWHWHIAVYLFLGGLVAGLMIFSSWFRLARWSGFERAILVSDIVGVPILSIGLLLLWIDLARRWNAWQFYATFQVTSAMSWGAWILLIAMLVLAVRLITHIPRPGEMSQSRLGRIWHTLRRWLAKLGDYLSRANRVWDVLTLLLGIGLGLYTGFLLNTIPARPLWNSSVLPFLFLASGLTSGCAFLFLFISLRRVKQLLPIALVLGIAELALIVAYVLSLMTGPAATQRAAQLLFGEFAVSFWGGVVLVGIFVPMLLEYWESRHDTPSSLLARTTPVLVLAGSAGLRFVVLYAGLRSFV